MKLKIIALCIGVMIVSSFLYFYFAPVSAEEKTSIFLGKFRTSVELGEQFNIPIVCHPTQPVKGYELKIYYDPTILQANTVTEGNIFQEYSTFFSKGIINNTEGSIINIYSVLLGEGNVVDENILVNISFTAIQKGTTTIDICDAGVANETEYVPLEVINGIVYVPQNWDVDKDGFCGFSDFMLVANQYGKKGPFGWIREDVDNNGIVGLSDLIILATHYGEIVEILD